MPYLTCGSPEAGEDRALALLPVPSIRLHRGHVCSGQGCVAGRLPSTVSRVAERLSFFAHFTGGEAEAWRWGRGAWSHRASERPGGWRAGYLCPTVTGLPKKQLFPAQLWPVSHLHCLPPRGGGCFLNKLAIPRIPLDKEHSRRQAPGAPAVVRVQMSKGWDLPCQSSSVNDVHGALSPGRKESVSGPHDVHAELVALSPRQSPMAGLPGMP